MLYYRNGTEYISYTCTALKMGVPYPIFVAIEQSKRVFNFYPNAGHDHWRRFVRNGAPQRPLSNSTHRLTWIGLTWCVAVGYQAHVFSGSCSQLDDFPVSACRNLVGGFLRTPGGKCLVDGLPVRPSCISGYVCAPLGRDCCVYRTLAYTLQ